MIPKIFSVLLLFVPLYLTVAQDRVIRKSITDKQFSELMEHIGVYEPGKNYNEIIDGHGTGLRPPTLEHWESIRNKISMVGSIKSTGDNKEILANYDNSATIWFPPVGSQGSEGSCVSWACVYFTKTFQEAVEHNWDLSGCIWSGGNPSPSYQNRIFSPDFVYHQVNNGVDKGSYVSSNMNLLEEIGCCTWDLMPYDDDDHISWPSEAAWRQAPLYRSSTGYTWLQIVTGSQLNALKNLLQNNNLAVIVIDANEYSNLSGDDLWTTDNYNYQEGNHANIIVGFDDDFGPYTENEEERYGALKIVNSWGPGWHGDGFYYISYACMQEIVQWSYFYENLADYTPHRVAVFRLTHSLRGECMIRCGIGSTSSPNDTKRLDNFGMDGGNHPFPSNKIVLDITEFSSSMSGSSDNFYLGLYDDGTAALGSIDSFSVEYYGNDFTSADPPVNTEASTWVFAETEVSSLLVQVRIFLEGAYDTESDQMTCSLKTGGHIPTTSPYSEDPRTVSSVPSDITDWVLVQIRSSKTGAAVASRSAFLYKDGSIVADDGSFNKIVLEADPDDYYMVVKHRNHLIVMSDVTVALSAVGSTLYDFTSGTDKYEGEDAALLETDVYGMYAGDGNESGIVTISDANLAITNRDAVGYEMSDYNLSGIVTVSDANQAITNRDAHTNVE